MQKITAAETLRSSILLLERRQIEEVKLLKEQFTNTYESLKPINLLRKVIIEMASPSDLRDDLFQTATGLITGYLSRKLLVRTSRNPILRLAGLFVQYSVTNFVAQNSATIKSLGLHFVNKFSGKYREEGKSL